MELLVPYKGPDREDPAFHILVRWCNTVVSSVAEEDILSAYSRFFLVRRLQFRDR